MAFALLGAILGISVLLGGSKITGVPAHKDARSNLMIAYNLVRSGSYALGDKTPRPTMLREPFPIVILATWMTVLGQANTANFEAINRGPGLAKLKFVNLLWTSASLILIFLIMRALTASDATALLTAALAVPFLIDGIDELCTEIPATSLVLASSYAMLLLVSNPTVARALIAGVCLGAAILTKAIILYAMPFVAIGTMVLAYMQTGSAHRALVAVLFLLTGAALVVTPWIVRNATVIGEAQIADRGPLVLYDRMLLDNMTWEEYRGSFYVWAPHRSQAPVGERIWL